VGFLQQQKTLMVKKTVRNGDLRIINYIKKKLFWNFQSPLIWGFKDQNRDWTGLWKTIRTEASEASFLGDLTSCFGRWDWFGIYSNQTNYCICRWGFNEDLKGYIYI
jgi:hypothetical protein